MQEPRPARVWDLPTRVFHWALVAGTAAAFLTGDEVRGTDLHAWLGAGVAGLLAFRLAWGFVGEGGARWARFPLTRAARRAYTPATPGHPPSGALSVLFVLALLAGIAATGGIVLGGEERRGPLAGLVGMDAGLDAHAAHRLLAWIVPVWLGAHLVGVVLHGRATGRPVIRAMVTGSAPAPTPTAARGTEPSPTAAAPTAARGAAPRLEPVAARTPAALALVAALAAGAAFAFVPPRAPAPPLPADPTWAEECGACHLAFHPSLLPARSWERTFATASDHFGEDLALPPATVATLRAYAAAHAAERGGSELGARIVHTLPPDAAPLRVTETEPWEAVHAALPEGAFADPAVGSALRCGACHPDAETGAFEGPLVTFPPSTPGS